MAAFKILSLVLGGILFLVSAAAFIYVKIKLRPGPSLDNFYHEFEDNHPDLQRYNKWSGITFTGVVIGILLLFIAIAV
jgi:hypothetical protein